MKRKDTGCITSSHIVTRCLGSRPRRDLGTIPDLGPDPQDLEILDPRTLRPKVLTSNSSIPFNTSELWPRPSSYTEIENGVHSGVPCYLPLLCVRSVESQQRRDCVRMRRLWRDEDRMYHILSRYLEVEESGYLEMSG